VAQRERVLEALAAATGERVLDVGSGPGMLAVSIAEAVGPGGRVAGIDVSDSMIAIARERADARPEGGAAIEFANAGAESLPYADASFDAAVSTQVLEYVPDVARALFELCRVLVPGGRVLVLDTDWDSIVLHSSDRARTERVLKAWEEHLVHPRLPRELSRMLRTAGFTRPGCEVVPMLTVGYERETYSCGMIELMADFVAGRDGHTREDADAWLADLIGLGEDYFFSVNRYLFTAVKPLA